MSTEIHGSPSGTGDMLTYERLLEYSDQIFRERKNVIDAGPKVDVRKLNEHGIPYAIDFGMVLVSSDGMKRAREVGAIVDGGVS